MIIKFNIREALEYSKIFNRGHMGCFWNSNMLKKTEECDKIELKLL